MVAKTAKMLEAARWRRVWTTLELHPVTAWDTLPSSDGNFVNVWHGLRDRGASRASLIDEARSQCRPWQESVPAGPLCAPVRSVGEPSRIPESGH
jgi:hypothetical protein